MQYTRYFTIQIYNASLWLERIKGRILMLNNDPKIGFLQYNKKTLFWLWGDRFCEFQLMIKARTLSILSPSRLLCGRNLVCSVLALQIFISHFFFIFLTGLDTTKNRFIILSVAVYTLYLYLYFFNMIWKCELYLCITTSHCIVDCVPGGLFLLVIGWCGSDVLNSISKVLFKWICCFANECFFCNYKNTCFMQIRC